MVLVAYPAIVVIEPGFRGPFLAGISALLLPFVFLRLSNMAWPALWLILLAGMYGMSSWFGPNTNQGITHTLALISTATTFLTFALYGSRILRYAWVRFMLALIIPVDMVAIYSAGLPKNATGASMIYVVAIACVVALRRTNSTGWKYAILYFTSGVIISFAFGVRSLVIYSVFFIITFFCACYLPRRTYWITGVIASTTVILSTIWFFLNIENVPMLAELSARIKELTGERANSGRDLLWPHVLRAVSDSPIFGLGAGVLPRDVLSTQLSSHNYYLQVYLQLGITGCGVIVLLLLAVWGILTRTTTASGRFGSAVFLMFVVHNGTEVLMFQNQTLIGVPAWCAIGFAIAIDRDSTLVERNESIAAKDVRNPVLLNHAIHRER